MLMERRAMPLNLSWSSDGWRGLGGVRAKLMVVRVLNGRHELDGRHNYVLNAR